MNRLEPLRVLAAGVSLSVILGACSSGASPSPSSAGGATTQPAPASAAPAPATATPAPAESKEFTVGYGTLSSSTIPVLAAADAMNASGYKVFVPIVAATEMSVQGVANGTFQFGAGSNSAALLAMQKGANIRFIVDDLSMEWALYAVTSIKGCSDLQDKRVGIGSVGGVSTALTKYYVQQNCAGVTPQYLTIGDSGTRALALAAGQIDATPVELTEQLTLQSKSPDKVHLLTSFKETLPNVKATSFYGNADWMKQNPTTTKAFVVALLEEHRKINADWQYLRTLLLKYMSDQFDESNVDPIAKAYVDGHYFDVNGGLTAEAVQGTIDFFTTGQPLLQPGLKVADALDLSYLDAALSEIGKK